MRTSFTERIATVQNVMVYREMPIEGVLISNLITI